jgi:hypothetical protein
MDLSPFVLENECLRLVVNPQRGGRIDSFLEKSSGKDWVWHPAGYFPGQQRSLPLGANFDDNWEGGWDDIFPSDAPGVHEGRTMYDHGELWSGPWETVTATHDKAVLRRTCQAVPVEVEKTVELVPHEARLLMRHKFRNLSAEYVPFLFKLHPALVIEPGDQILMPDCELEPVSLDFSTLAGRMEKSPFPYVVASDGDRRRIDEIAAPHTGAREFLYAQNLSAGWCALRNARTQSRLTFIFHRHEFPFVWIFESFTGFKGHYVVMLEPCTNVPYDLEQAQQRGRCSELPPYGLRFFATEVVITRD